MNFTAYCVINKPKARPPPDKCSFEATYDHACIEFLYACFSELPRHEIIARAERMREARINLERR